MNQDAPAQVVQDKLFDVILVVELQEGGKSFKLSNFSEGD